MENTENTVQAADAWEARLARAEAHIEHLQETLARLTPPQAAGTTLVAPVRIVNAQGKALAEVQEEHSQVTLRMFDKKENVGASLGIDSFGGFLTIRSKENVMVVYINVEDSGARLCLSSNEGESGGEGVTGVAIFGGGDHGGGINIGGKSEAGGVCLWSEEDGGSVEIYHADTGASAILLTTTTTGASIEIFDKEDTTNVLFKQP